MIAFPGRLPQLKLGLIRALPILLTLLWIGAVLCGLGKLWAYEQTPAYVASSLVQWPASVPLSHPFGGATLVMAAHPCCPCTRASVSELARIMARTPRPIAAYVLFYKPHILPRDWEKTDLYDRAAAIPGVTALWDEDGREAGHFHATTSGQTLLFNAEGRLLFSGGITSARGMEGDSPGQEALRAILRGESVRRTSFPVFGCSLLAPK